MSTQQRILLLFAHPASQRSRANARLAREVRELPGLTFHDLYEAYPDFDVDVEREQELLAAHDLVVVQHPLFWYSTPALVKEWEDLVLQHGWAYGTDGTALQGKRWLTAITTGGGPEGYREEGIHRHTLRQFLAPLEQTALLCGMEYLPPFVVQRTHALSDDELSAHAAEYRRLLEALRDGSLDDERLRAASYLNELLDGEVS
ncbi:MAG: NAD(P)H-dependent oxidoreductase [Acidobacteriota bacterium]